MQHGGGWVGGPDPAAEGGKSGVTGGKLNPHLLHHLPARRMANSEFAFLSSYLQSRWGGKVMLNLSSATLLSRKTKAEDSIFLQLRRRRLSRIYDLFDKKKEKEKKVAKKLEI